MSNDINDALELLLTAPLSEVQKLVRGELKLAMQNGSYKLCDLAEKSGDVLFYESLSSGWLDAHIPPWVMKDDRLRQELIEYLRGMSGHLY